MPAKIWAIAAVVAVLGVAVAGTIFYIGSLPKTGTLAVAVHDAPCSDCAHVWVNFSTVSVHASNSSGGGWTTLNVSGSTVDLMALNGTALAKVIGVATLAAGHYEQIRLSVSSVVVGLSDGTNLTAHLPAVSSANVNGAFNVTAGATTTIAIDVDLQSSLHIVGVGATATATFTPNIGAVVVM